MINIRKLQEAMNRNDTKGIVRELYKLVSCSFCESWGQSVRCKAPGCTAVGCPECIAFHSLAHLEDDPKDQRPI